MYSFVKIFIFTFCRSIPLKMTAPRKTLLVLLLCSLQMYGFTNPVINKNSQRPWADTTPTAFDKVLNGLENGNNTNSDWTPGNVVHSNRQSRNRYNGLKLYLEFLLMQQMMSRLELDPFLMAVMFNMQEVDTFSFYNYAKDIISGGSRNFWKGGSYMTGFLKALLKPPQGEVPGPPVTIEFLQNKTYPVYLLVF